MRDDNAIATRLAFATDQGRGREMAGEVRPIRRVVTGDDAQGRSCVLFDTAAPNVNPGAISRGTCMTDIWVYQHLPAMISGARDEGNMAVHFEPPDAGGHLSSVP